MTRPRCVPCGAATLWSAAAAALAVACGGVIAENAHGDATGPCGAALGEEARVWNDAERARVAAALGSVGPAYAARTARDVTTALDETAAAWRAGRTSACAAESRTPAPNEGSAAAACYDEALTALRAAVSGVARSDRTTLPYATDVVDHARNVVDRCLHPAALVTFAPHPVTDPAKLAQARSLLADAEVRLVQNDPAAVSRDATRAESLGLRLDDAHVVADARLLLARAAVRERNSAEARTVLEGVTPYSESTDPLSLALLLRTKADATADPVEAERGAEQASSLVERVLGAESAEALDYEQHLAESERARREPDRAIARYAHVIGLAERGRGPARRMLARAHFALGRVYSALGANREAEREARAGLMVSAQAHGPEHPISATAHLELSALLAARRDFAAAAPEAEHALAARVAAFGEASLDVAAALSLTGDLSRELGKNDVALDAYTRALAIDVRLLGPSSPEVGDLHQSLGRTLESLGRLDQALPELQRALSIQEDSKSAAGPELAATHDHIGTVLRAAKRYDDALFEHHLAVQLLKEAEGPGDAAIAAEQGRIASILEEQGKLDDATETYREVLRLDEGAFGKDHPTTGKDHQSLGRVLGLAKQFPEAVSELRLALSIHERTLGKEHPDVAADRRDLGLALAAMGKTKDALPELSSALAFYEKETPVDLSTVEELRAAIAKAAKKAP
jgi:tetratricopeptide (TPR) repeat protein